MLTLQTKVTVTHETDHTAQATSCFHFKHFNESEQKDLFVNSDTSMQAAGSRKSYHFSSLILSVSSHHGHWM